MTGLEGKGFQRLNERESWANGRVKRGGKYFVTRNQSSIIAFTVPESEGKDTPLGMSIVG